jgi:hypothetical protein
MISASSLAWSSGRNVRSCNLSLFFFLSFNLIFFIHEDVKFSLIKIIIIIILYMC